MVRTSQDASALQVQVYIRGLGYRRAPVSRLLCYCL